MDSQKIQKYLSYVIKTLFAMLGLLFLLAIYDIESNKKSPEEISKMLKESQEMREIMAKRGHTNIKLPDPWPAKMNKPYPDFSMFDQGGNEFTLSSLKGKVIIIEFIDISSPISQAQSGAGLMGAYYGAATKDVDKYALPFSQVLRNKDISGLTLPNPNIIEVKVIIYGEGGEAGSRDDAQNWAKHFDLKRSDNIIVAVPKKDIRDPRSVVLIGGFQLIDKNMLLRVDSAGSEPKHNLTMTLIPLVHKLIR